MKRKLAFCIIVAMLMTLCLSGYTPKAQEDIVLSVESPYGLLGSKKVQIDENDLSVKPIVENGTTLVPVRFVAENFDCRVTWQENGTITIQNPKTIVLTLGAPEMLVDGEAVSLPVPAKLIGERAYVPLRSISEALGKYVFYDRGLIIISSEIPMLDPQADKEQIDQLFLSLNSLPVVGTQEELEKMLEEQAYAWNINGYVRAGGGSKGIMMESASIADSAADISVPKANAAPESQDFSETNTQVQGVDEADIIKTDGQYIYRISGKHLFIIKAVPADSMELVSSYDLAQMEPSQIFLSGDTLVVMGTTYREMDLPAKAEDETADAVYRYTSPTYQQSMTKALILDLHDRSTPSLVRELELEGNYLTSRKIGDNLYFIANRYMYPNIISHPCFYDTKQGRTPIAIDYGAVRYFPDTAKDSMISIGSIDLSDYHNDFHITTYLTSGNHVYMSQNALYIASNQYQPWGVKSDGSFVSTEEQQPSKTQLYKFSLQGDTVTYHSKGEIVGTLINQFSMDEYNGYLRVGATSHDTNPSVNYLYILDKNMQLCGQIDNIAPGEQIYSTRFMGDRGYMVTFRTTDPLFAMDLSDPTNPQILGQLKIPGYSNYMQPYDETHIIGFGKDAQTDDMDNSYYQGFKMAIFDVTDITNPVEMFTEHIGVRGTDSQILYDHKALLLDPERNLLVFPISVYQDDLDNQQWSDASPITRYGVFSHQGAYVYQVDLENGFTFRDSITHMEPKPADHSEKYGWEYSQYNRFVDRCLTIGNTLYTSSNQVLQAHSLDTLDQIGGIVLPIGDNE